MTPAPLDHTRAKYNPWGLTAHQCLALRLVCKYGGSKRAHYNANVSARLIEHHLHNARKQMGYVGSDIRMFLAWDRWTTKQGNQNEH